MLDGSVRRMATLFPPFLFSQQPQKRIWWWNALTRLTHSMSGLKTMELPEVQTI